MSVACGLWWWLMLPAPCLAVLCLLVRPSWRLSPPSAGYPCFLTAESNTGTSGSKSESITCQNSQARLTPIALYCATKAFSWDFLSILFMCCPFLSRKKKRAKHKQLFFNNVQTRCIAKGEAQRSPHFRRFSEGFWFSQERLFSRNPTRKPLSLQNVTEFCKHPL